MTATGADSLASIMAAAGEDLPGLLDRAETRLHAIAAGAAGDGAGPVSAAASRTLAAGGKRLRPLLVFLCAGDAHGEELVRAAVAVELVHMAALLHDDVLDRAELRRGRPTVYASHGRDTAVATGDFLFARAFAELTPAGSPEAARHLSDAASALVRGELMQRADAWSRSVRPARYIERCSLKTARLFGAACRLGAHFGNPDDRSARALGEFGESVGLAFQLFDDVLDVAGPVERTGKARGADLLDGTVTLPLIIAVRRDRGLGSVDLREAVAEHAVEDLCDRIAATGALDEVREVALRHVAEAKSAIERADLPERQREVLALVADGVVDRQS